MRQKSLMFHFRSSIGFTKILNEHYGLELFVGSSQCLLEKLPAFWEN